MSDSPVLFGYFRSSCSWRVRIALALKEVAVEDVAVHLVKDGGQQHQHAHRERNPMGQVPVLAVDDHMLSQSMAILLYLDERFPEPALLPSDRLERAKCIQFSEMVNAGIQPLQNLAVMQHLQQKYSWTKAQALEWSAHWIDLGLKALEASALTMSGDFCIGNQVTIADCCLYPQLYNARRFGLDMENYPTLHGIEHRLAAHPAFISTHPSRQPDTPPELRA
ncbi:MAG: maleylacetoacetate isomerase [Bradymonadia bacterium]